jgi:hypothetical protein
MMIRSQLFVFSILVTLFAMIFLGLYPAAVAQGYAYRSGTSVAFPAGGSLTVCNPGDTTTLVWTYSGDGAAFISPQTFSASVTCGQQYSRTVVLAFPCGISGVYTLTLDTVSTDPAFTGPPPASITFEVYTPALIVSIATDKTAYKPGETAAFSGTVTWNSHGRSGAVAAAVQISRDGQPVPQVTSDSDGNFHGSIQITPDLQGSHTLSATASPLTGCFDNGSAQTAFSIITPPPPPPPSDVASGVALGAVGGLTGLTAAAAVSATQETDQTGDGAVDKFGKAVKKGVGWWEWVKNYIWGPAKQVGEGLVPLPPLVGEAKQVLEEVAKDPKGFAGGIRVLGGHDQTPGANPTYGRQTSLQDLRLEDR